MAEKKKPAWPRTPRGDIDWEAVFEDPETGLIVRMMKAKTPKALRQNSAAIIGKMYAKEELPETFREFVDGLDNMLPDGMAKEAMDEAAEAIAGVMRSIKNERLDQVAQLVEIRKRRKDADLKNAQKKGRGRKGSKKGKRSLSPAQQKKIMLIAATVMFVLLGSGAGGWWYLSGPDVTTYSSKTMQLIAEMKAAAQGKGPERHVFGWGLSMRKEAGIVGVTAIGVPADACAGAAWTFVTKGNVMINDILPEQVSPTVLKYTCALKGQRAKLTWLQKESDVLKNIDN